MLHVLYSKKDWLQFARNNLLIGIHHYNEKVDLEEAVNKAANVIPMSYPCVVTIKEINNQFGIQVRKETVIFYKKDIKNKIENLKKLLADLERVNPTIR